MKRNNKHSKQMKNKNLENKEVENKQRKIYSN